MDIVDYATDFRISSKKVSLSHDVDRLNAVGRGIQHGKDYRLVDALLVGGAPWGFTLRGGLEHREPLVITKVEEGSKAATRLQAGDEIVSINAVPLSGSRQEAICLVKSSYKSLALVVRRNMKMVDIVSQTMPSENEVHVARNFLTKILRSSMRGNELVSRPHSWHSSKFTGDHSEPSETLPKPAPVWQAKHEASSSSKDLSSCGDHTNLRQVGSMERVERPSHLFSAGRCSPTRYSSSTEPIPGSAAASSRDSGFSCFSTSSSPPDPPLSNSNAASTESMFYKGVQSEKARQSERPKYLQLPVGNGGRESPVTEDQPGSRYSSSGRSSVGPVWHVPERKKAAPPSPPPPPPPLRSDSFAATKVFPYTEGPDGHAQLKSQGRGMDRLCETSDHSIHRDHHVSHNEKGPDARRSYNAPHKKDFLHPNTAAADCNHNQLNPNKLYSLSSTDVRQSQSPLAYLPNHQRQYSDESTFYLQTRAIPPPKPQSVGSYYRSLQDLPTNVCNRNQVRTSSASLSNTTIDQKPDSGGHIRYYCITAKHPAQSEPHVRQGKAEGWRTDTQAVQGTNHNDRNSISSHKANKVKYPLPQPQPSYPNSKDRNGHLKPANGLLYGHQSSSQPSASRSSSEEKDSQRRGEGNSSETQLKRFSPNQPNEHKVVSLREMQQDPWLSREDHRISPQKTPMLHCLSQESRSLTEKHPATNSCNATQETQDSIASKLARRSDRYATTLRNEIQLKRAQLQKSRSAATLTCPSEADEELEVWRSSETSTSSDGSFSNTYKDHLKEAQARVLQATSFRRRDLEPPGTEAPSHKPSTTNGQMSRIGGRKRFTLDKRIHSYSEPDQINKVGVEGEHPTGTAGSFVDRRKFFEMAAKPAFSRPVPKPGLQSSSGEHGEGKTIGRPHPGDHHEDWRRCPASETPSEPHHSTDPDPLSPGHRQAMLEQQRLGTFAEYQATWSLQRKPTETKTQGRYHSAENILDPGAEEKPVCVHERSRSSPSADFYGQTVPAPWRESVELPYLEHRHDQQGGSTTRGHIESGVSHRPVQLDQFPQSPESAPKDESQNRDVAAPLPSDHRLQPDPGDPAHTLPPYPPSHSLIHGHVSEPPATPQDQGLMPQRPHLCPETTSSSYGDSQEFLPGSQAEQVARSCSPDTQLDPSPACGSSLGLGSSLGPSPSPGRNSGLDTGREEEREAADSALLSTAQPPPSSSSSSPLLSSRPASLSVPSTDGTCCLSPQFAPQRLTDKPPLSMQDEAQSRPENRMANVMELNSVVKNIPVKIVHAESSAERVGRQYLPPSQALGGGEGPSPPQPTLLASLDQSHSLFCTYTRKGPQRASDPSPPRDRTLPVVPAERLSTEMSRSNGTSGAGRPSEEEDVKREELARDIMGKDKSLADILDQSRMRTTMDLMEGIFPQGEQLLEGTHQRRKAPKHASPRNTDDRREEEGLSAAVSLVTSSSYYSTSAPKAELLIKMKDMQEQMEEEQDSEDELDINLAGKKEELIDSLSRKLQVLREARESLQEDVQDNNALGAEVEAMVRQVCKPNELDKFCMFVGDLDKVVSLLLSLSGRLARVENALNTLEEDTSPEEKHTLTEKRKLLIRQHEDAKELKENLDRRERLVYSIMASYLSQESLADYQHFVKMKSALIIEQRKLEDKIKLGEEQLKCLLDSLPLEQRLLF